MNELYQNRLSRHLRQMLRYLRLVFNDHFVIALMFFVGGLGLAYANWLKTVSPRDTWIVLVVGLILWLGLALGRVATLLEPADVVFLLPREHDLHGYFVHAWRYSWWLAQAVQVVLVGLTVPILMLVDRLSGLSLLALLVTQLALKDSQLTGYVTRLYRLTAAQRRWSQLGNWGLALVILALSLFSSTWLGLG